MSEPQGNEAEKNVRLILHYIIGPCFALLGWLPLAETPLFAVNHVFKRFSC